MKTWRIWYHYWEDEHVKEDVVYIEADDFDEAIKKPVSWILDIVVYKW